MKAVQKGFTLVEIAIVLVIIGLLLGGILKGQEMITQAKIKNVVADFSGISAAYYGYQDRYRAIPGDDPNAQSRWGATAFPGDGNGVVAGAYNVSCPVSASATAPESCLWWDDLRRAGFVAGNGGQAAVQCSHRPTRGANRGRRSPVPIMGTDAAGTGGFAGLIVCSANLPDKIAIAVDTQMDDGVPDSGTVRGLLAEHPRIRALQTAATSTYQETGTNTYLLCRSL